jgi:hypothetical protein
MTGRIVLSHTDDGVRWVVKNVEVPAEFQSLTCHVIIRLQDGHCTSSPR